MTTAGTNCEWFEDGAVELYLAGALPSEEESHFTTHLSGCGLCQAAREAAADLPAWLAAETALAPPAALRERVLSVATPGGTHQPWRSWGPKQAEEMAIVRNDEGTWTTAGEGVFVKQLFADSQRGEVTMLIRMEPGSRFPSHRHGGPEQCLVVEGELIVGDVTLQAGDFQCAPVNSIHDVSRTEKGCVLLILSSQHDQLLG